MQRTPVTMEPGRARQEDQKVKVILRCFKVAPILGCMRPASWKEAEERFVDQCWPLNYTDTLTQVQNPGTEDTHTAL